MIINLVVSSLIYSLYFLAAWLCNEAAKHKKGRFWQLLFILIIAMICNRILGIDKIITEIGRKLAHAEMWYEYRRQPQIFMTLTAVIGTLTAVGSLFILKPRLWNAFPILVGFTLLLIITLVKMISLHEVDMWLAISYGSISLSDYHEFFCLLLMTLPMLLSRERIKSYRPA